MFRILIYTGVRAGAIIRLRVPNRDFTSDSQSNCFYINKIEKINLAIYWQQIGSDRRRAGRKSSPAAASAWEKGTAGEGIGRRGQSPSFVFTRSEADGPGIADARSTEAKTGEVAFTFTSFLISSALGAVAAEAAYVA